MNIEKSLKDEEVFAEPILPPNNISSKLENNVGNADTAAAHNEQQQQSTIISDFRYQQPNWALIPAEGKDQYFLEIIKEGTVIDTIRLHDNARQKSFWSIGRFEPCDIKLEHPSVSRFHAILQYGECVKGRPGWFLFDMNSTHGVKLNKRPIKKRTYIPLHNGFTFQIAGSSRLFTVCGGPSTEADDERKDEKVSSPIEKNHTDKDADEEGDEEHHKFFEKDPIAWLQKYFEREGVPMHFNFTKSASDRGGDGVGNLLAEFEDEQNKKKGGRRKLDEGHWTCSIELVTDVSLTCGNVVSVSAPSKRLAQLQCALVACERLNDACLLRISSLWNKRKNYAENDFYDSDEDIFFDRTGQIEEQREKRRLRFGTDSFGSSVGHAKNYAELVKELAEVETKLEVVRQEMQRLLQKDKIREEQQEGGGQSPKQLNFSTRMALSQLKGKEKKLQEEKTKLQKLSEIAKPSRLLERISQKGVMEEEKKIGLSETSNTIESNSYETDREIMKSDKRRKVETDENEESKRDTKPQDMVGGQEVQPVAGPSAVAPQTDEKHNDREVKEIANPRHEEATVDDVSSNAEERFYAPALPPKHNQSAENVIVPKFGMLTKEEMARMKMLQKQIERKPELAVAVKKARFHKEEDMAKADNEELQRAQNIREKYATWLPPDDQSGDGSTRLNKKFAGKY